MHYRKIITPAALAALMLTTSALAQDLNTSTEQIVVTATRTAQPTERTGESVSVIGTDELSAQQIAVVSDALAQVPGVMINREGGVGQPTTISIRGADAGQTLVLVDGVRINDPTSTDDEALLGDLLANNIRQIEVLRGPQSTLYGSDAIGGVANILTRLGGDSPFAANATAEGGSFDTLHLNAGANGTVGDLDYGAAANFFHSNGISSADSRYDNNWETSHYTNFGLTENARLRLDDRFSVDLRSYFTSSRYDFDNNYLPPLYLLSDSSDYGTNQLAAGYLGVNADFFNGRFHNRLAIIGSDSDRVTYPTPGQPDDFFALGGVERLEYQGIVDVNDANQATFGAEDQRSDMATGTGGAYGFTPRVKGSDQIGSIYGQWQSMLFDQLTVTGGIRFDHDHEFGDHVSLKAAGAWSLLDGATVLRANYGDGFKAPTLYELFSEYSNPFTALRPEIAHGWEVGADQLLFDGRIRTAVTYFERLTADQINFFDCFSPSSGPGCAERYLVGGYYYNVDRSRAEGVEAEASAKLTDTLQAKLSYTNMTAINLADRTDLLHIPNLTADASLTWTPTADISLGGTIGFVGKRWDDAANTVPLSSNTLVNFFGSYNLTGSLQLFARMENAFGIRYEPVYGYGAPGRAIYAGVRANY